MESVSDDESSSFSSKCTGHVARNEDREPDVLPTASSASKTETFVPNKDVKCNDIELHDESTNCISGKSSVIIQLENNESSPNDPVTVAVVPTNSRSKSPKNRTKKRTLLRTRSHPLKIAPVELDAQKVSKKCPIDIEVKLKNDAKNATQEKSNASVVDEHCSCAHASENGSSQDEENSPRFWFLKYSRKQRLTLLSLCLVDFTSFLGMSIMAPFFPMEAAEKGMDEFTVGFVFSAYALVMFIASPLFGHVLPHVGSKFMFLSGLFLAAGCTVLFGMLDELSGTTFYVFCFVTRSFEALGAAAYNTASCTMVADMFPDNVGAVFGLLETFVGLGSAIGPAIGGALYAVGGYKLPFLLLGAFMIVMVPLNILLLPASEDAGAIVKSGSMIQLLKIPTVLILVLIILVQASAWAFLDPYLEPHLQDFSLNTETVGLIFLMLAATYGIFCPIWGWVADRWNYIKCMMITGMIITSFSLLLLGPSNVVFPFLENELWLNIVSLNIMGLAMAMALIPTFQSMMDCAFAAGFKDDVSTYSLVSGTWSAAYSFGDFAGPSIGGILVTSFGFPTAATGIAGLIGIAALIALLYEVVVILRTKSTPSMSGTFKNLPNDVTIVTEQTPLLKSL